MSQQGAVSYFVSNRGCISFLIAQYVIAVSFATENCTITMCIKVCSAVRSAIGDQKVLDE